jgi:cellulose synthase/poly-beta-1,6-N-acetylglucosamine synthase-like glycosyltransferase
MSSKKGVSIIIPVKRINNYIRESVSHILKLDYDEFEIIILPDEADTEVFSETRIIATGPVGPAEKRDIGSKNAKGEILAFLDDDAYPRSDWLKNAVRHFENPDIGAIGGPAVTPADDSIWQKASGAVFASWLASGKYDYRYIPRNSREVDDYPSVNLIVKKDIFNKAGGFDSNYWPGEDTKLCLDITKKLGKKIIYDPDVLVYHHRRPLFLSHLRQVSRYAFHRGYFAKILPETSLRFGYFVPSLFFLGLFLGGILSAVHNAIFLLYITILLMYIVMLLGTAMLITLREKDIFIGTLAVPGIFLTHLVYGYNFIKGLLEIRYKK